MTANAISCSVRGIAGVPVDVEADVAGGLPAVNIVGLTDRAIQEARERVRAAVRNAGFEFPQHRITVNLAPAEVPKEGTGFDLAIAAAVLSAGGRRLDLAATALLGELGLDGGVRPITGVLPMVRCLQRHGVPEVIVPAENAAEAAMVPGIRVVAAASLRRCVAHLDGSDPLPAVAAQAVPDAAGDGPDLDAVRGQFFARRALEIAVAGSHNILMLGPPGSGKTLLARTVASLLPDLSPDDQLDVAAIYSLRGAFKDRAPGSVRPPFRAPHHSVSRAGLIGGGSGLASPGEISLAHKGTLFLDELCEFPRSHIEALRQPLEERVVVVARARGSVGMPADIMLVAAANPCPCGHLGDSVPCTCSARELAGYRSRLSGPLRDRIDLIIDVPRQRYADIFDAAGGEDSATVRRRIEAARERQRARSSATNAAMDGHHLLAVCAATPAATRLLARAGERLQLSARGFFRVLRVARSIADLAGAERVGESAVAEALRYRGDAVALGAVA